MRPSGGRNRTCGPAIQVQHSNQLSTEASSRTLTEGPSARVRQLASLTKGLRSKRRVSACFLR